MYCFLFHSSNTVLEQGKYIVAFHSTRATRFRTREIYIDFRSTRLSRCLNEQNIFCIHCLTGSDSQGEHTAFPFARG